MVNPTFKGPKKGGHVQVIETHQHSTETDMDIRGVPIKYAAPKFHTMSPSPKSIPPPIFSQTERTNLLSNKMEKDNVEKISKSLPESSTLSTKLPSTSLPASNRLLHTGSEGSSDSSFTAPKEAETSTKTRQSRPKQQTTSHKQSQLGPKVEDKPISTIKDSKLSLPNYRDERKKMIKQGDADSSLQQISFDLKQILRIPPSRL
jgi:hypothetical protein